jgi:hypothetical protein
VGGNCIKTVPIRRYEKKEYEGLCIEVLDRLLEAGYCAETTVAYGAKKDFGDMDVLYIMDSSKPMDHERIRKLFPESREINRNSDVFSFEFRDFQIDLIGCQESWYDYAKIYFEGSDCLGNLVGKITRKFGLKHGHNGLFLPLRDGDREYAEILVNLDPRKTLEFVGLSLERYDQGFENLTDLFDYVISSPYFDPHVYKLENVSYKGRVRDRKRTTYTAFLEYTKGKTYPDKKSPLNKHFELERVFEWFPDARKAYDEAVTNLALSRVVKAKFNGALVAEVTGLQGKELGEFMQILKKDFYFQKTILLVLTDEEVREKIRSSFEQHKEAHEKY